MGRFLAQKWINDSDSRREAEREMARAGGTMCRALWTFYWEVCKWEEVEVDDTLTFTMVVSPEVCRLFVNWIEKSRPEDRPRFYKDLVYAALMEDAMQVQKMRTICGRIKDWMRDMRLMNLKDALDIMIDGLTTNGSTTSGSITNGLTTNESMTDAPITDEPGTNGSKSTTVKQWLETERSEWWERLKSEVELATHLQREEEERAEKEKRESIKAGKSGVNPDQGNALLDTSWRAGSTETVIWRGDDAEEQTGSEDSEPNIKDSVPEKNEPSL